MKGVAPYRASAMVDTTAGDGPRMNSSSDCCCCGWYTGTRDDRDGSDIELGLGGLEKDDSAPVRMVCPGPRGAV